MPDIVIFHKALDLGDNICGSFNAVSIRYLLQDIQKHKITDCYIEPSCKCAEKSDVSQQRHNAAHNSVSQVFLLSVCSRHFMVCTYSSLNSHLQRINNAK